MMNRGRRLKFRRRSARRAPPDATLCSHHITALSCTMATEIQIHDQNLNEVLDRVGAAIGNMSKVPKGQRKAVRIITREYKN